MAPARPLRGGAGSGRAAATTTRPQGALPGSARAHTKDLPGGSKPGAAGGAEQPQHHGHSARPWERRGRDAERPPPRSACAAASARAAVRSALPAPAIILTGSSPRARLPRAGAGRRRRPRPRPWSAPAGAVPVGPQGQWPPKGPQQQPRRRHTSALHAALSPFYRHPPGTLTEPLGPRQPSRDEAPRQQTQGLSHRCVTQRSRAGHGGGSAGPAEAWSGRCPSPAPPPRRPRPHGTAGCAYLRPPPAPPRTGEKGEQPRPPPRTSTSATRDWPRHRPPRGAAVTSLGEAAARQHGRRRRDPHRPPWGKQPDGPGERVAPLDPRRGPPTFPTWTAGTALGEARAARGRPGKAGAAAAGRWENGGRSNPALCVQPGACETLAMTGRAPPIGWRARAAGLVLPAGGAWAVPASWSSRPRRGAARGGLSSFSAASSSRLCFPPFLHPFTASAESWRFTWLR